MEEALSIARGINSDYWKIRILLDISTEMSKQGQVEKSVSVVQEMLFIARGISDDNDEKSSALQNVARALSKQSQMDESLAILRSISNDWGTENVLSEIAVEFGKQGNFQMAEAVGIEIPRIRKRQQTWEETAETRVKIDGWQNALKQFEIFQSDEAKLFYLRGWTENLSTIDVNDICIQNALPIINKDNESIENLLQKYAINLMMGNPSLDLTDRLNRTLNIQWILDIIANVPQPDVSNRLSTNLDIWLHEISDEDDRDDIKNWAKKVEDGKMLEERFIEKLKNMI
jgi:hypothetical protein